jgi:translation initiation factor 2 alpha subunit (eIF-2alpha)
MEPAYDRIAFQQELITLIRKHKGNSMEFCIEHMMQDLEEAFGQYCKELAMGAKFGGGEK